MQIQPTKGKKVNLRSTREKFFNTAGGHRVEVIRERRDGTYVVKFLHAHRIKGLLYPAGAEWAFAPNGKFMWDEECGVLPEQNMLNIAGVWSEPTIAPRVDEQDTPVKPVVLTEATILPDLPPEEIKPKRNIISRWIGR